MSDIYTIILLLILAASLGVILLFLQNKQATDLEHQGLQHGLNMIHEDLIVVLDRLSSAADRERGLKQLLIQEGQLTRERIAQVKTRLADEERQNQQDLAHSRYERGKEEIEKNTSK